MGDVMWVSRVQISRIEDELTRMGVDAVMRRYDEGQ